MSEGTHERQERDPSERGVTRRGLIAGAATVGAAAALPGGAQAASLHRRAHRPRKAAGKGSSSNSADVIVVGGGLSGLVAAREVVAGGRSAIVLEARNRVGGRIWGYPLGNGDVAERGGTFIGPTQDKLAALAQELKIDTFPTYDTGNDLYVADGQKMTYSDTSPLGTAPPDATATPYVVEAVQDLDTKAATIDVTQPWANANAETWDGQTLETYLQAQSSNDHFHRLISTACRPIFGCEPREISLLFTLFYIASSGDEKNTGTFERNFDTRQGAQMSRFVGGSQLIPEGVAGGLGSAVRINQAVRRITQSGSGAQVVTDTDTFSGRRVIVACAPALAGRIYYEPLLPEARDQLTQRLGMGNLIKISAVYPTPFWREQGLNGQVVSIDGIANVTFDDSPPSGSPGVLLAFVGGDGARLYQQIGSAAGRNMVLSEFATYFGSQAMNPTTYVETNWTGEEWTRGCPVGLGAPGVLFQYGTDLRAPCGLIHWAGTETSTYWNGYMDGAVRAGQRAASEVLSEL